MVLSVFRNCGGKGIGGGGEGGGNDEDDSDSNCCCSYVSDSILIVVFESEMIGTLSLLSIS